MQSKKVIIIGAGVGGVTSAIYLAQKGFDVHIFEKNNYPGGRCSFVEKNGHRFDIGATLLMMTDIYEKAYELMGHKLQDELDLIRMDPVYHINFKNKKSVVFTSDLSSLKRQFESLEEGSFERFLQYMDESYTAYKKSMKQVIDKNYQRATDFFNLKTGFLLWRLKAFRNLHKHTSRFFKSDLLKTVFTFQNIYVGQNPFKASAIFAMLPFLELIDGVWFPKGGMGKITENLISIAKKNNVKIHYSSLVEKILQDGDKVNGIELAGGSKIQGDIVLSNADLPYVYKNLLNDAYSKNKTKKFRYTCSAFMFHWGMKKVYPQLNQHNVYVSSDYKTNIDALFEHYALPDEPSFYVHAPCRHDKSAAPEGKDSVSVIVPTGHIVSGRDYNWEELKIKARKSVLERLEEEGMSDFENNIDFEICYTPNTWDKVFNLSNGAIFGSLSHDIMQMGYMRPQNQHKKFKNLFFTGGSTHPGNGVPMVLLSAKLTADKVLHYINKH
ncbi:MAG: phytoene desaturase family protein [Bacteroidales bacterium]|nr:phytoene desaturase family protein [Bacteroidales bacterium]